MKEEQGFKRNKTLVGMQHREMVVEYVIVCEENKGSEGKTMKDVIFERSSLSFPSLNFSLGDVTHQSVCV